jgi:hypothetical protein
MSFSSRVFISVAIALTALASELLGAELTAKQDDPAEVEDNRNDEVTRFFEARKLIRQTKYEEATAELIALWDLENDPSALRHTFFFLSVQDLKQLIQNYEPARKAFSDMRDKLSASLKKPSWWSSGTLDRQDWVYLNALLGEDEHTLSWFDSIKNKQGWKQIEGMSWGEVYIHTLLKDRKRWADLTLAGRDPLSIVRTLGPVKKMMEKLDAGGPPHDLDIDGAFLRRTGPLAPGYYVGYLQREMPNKAAAYGELVGAIPGSSGFLLQMVELAIVEGAASPAQQALLDLAEKQGADVKELRAQLETALAEKK